MSHLHPVSISPQGLAWKVEWCVWLPDVEKCLMICLAVSTQYRRVSDICKDRQTDILRQHNPSYACASRGGNMAHVTSDRISHTGCRFVYQFR